jgi:nitrate reductase delta subunit
MRLWADSTAHAAPFAAAPKGLIHLEAVERLKDWTRSRFGLAESDALMVSESECQVPGGPPTQTVVAFWTDDGTRHRFRVFRSVREVTEEDIPPAWLKAALAADDAIECACC